MSQAELFETKQDDTSCLKPGARVTFAYGGPSGSTLRSVTIEDVDEHFVWGFCHLRDAVRCFRVDRIRNPFPTPGVSGVLKCVPVYAAKYSLLEDVGS